MSRPVALVTAGAGAGIGAAVVRTLASEGWDVVVSDAHERRSAELAAELGEEHGRDFLSVPLDVTDFDAVGAAVERIVGDRGRIDGLVNNAGWSVIKPIAEMDPAEWRKCLEIDLTGTFHCLRQVLPRMIEQGSGAVVNMASIAAWEMTEEHGGAYSAAKAGVVALTRVAAAEVGRKGVRVNAIAPGLIYNDFLRKIYPPEFFDSYAETRSRVGRVGAPEDVAALTAFLLGEKAGYITGEVYGISGGVAPLA
ncbi:MAG: SDR family oxidoreductase [Actinobacteria bacterium]|nr:SDR family oxidoreductase [Actinomycetota bacterium]